MTPVELLSHVHARGVALWAEGNLLRWRCPGGLPDTLRADLVACKSELLALLVDRPPPLTAEQRAAVAETIAERAAIQELEGELPREEADTQAAAAMRVYRYRLSDKIDGW